MATIDPTLAVQNGLRNLLLSDPEITQYVTGVLDEVPDSSARNYPFVVLPDVTSTPDGTHDDAGRMVSARFQVFARGDVEERQIGLRVAGRIMSLLDHQCAIIDTFVEDHSVWMVKHAETRRLPDGDRSVRRLMVRIDLWVTNS